MLVIGATIFDIRSVPRSEAAAGAPYEADSALVDALGRISASSRKIGDIIAVIVGIAFQTHVLALNAAAERALVEQSAAAARSLQQQAGELARFKLA